MAILYIDTVPNGKYLVVDTYEGDYEELGFCDTLKGVEDICKERADDTDGECYLQVFKYDRDKKVYLEIDWTYEYEGED